ncbi:hypothetical protein N8I77_013059 [Diaporthe amygdali]|uniref:Extracellular serine-rich protein n=1 Tax=Phomopsis amygdali TaxID=1214568 RepID=A0AAD9VYN3_PHOAM|nr:hypothetical protein N8I77_013059 [Diaporthe amygdali]
MRRLLSTICLALTAARQSWAVDFAVNSQPLAPSTPNKIIPVLVGGTALTFTPNSITANPGDVLQFQFAARNHTVTQSLPSSPCQPVEGPGGAAGVNSGFIPFDGGASGMVGTFNVPVMNTQPMFLYCAQAMHCQQGMVMTVNAQPADLINYFNAAARAPANIPGRTIAGGIAANIPLANAVLPKAPTGANTTATATVFTTVIVPPSAAPPALAPPPPPPPPPVPPPPAAPPAPSPPPPAQPARGGDGADPAATTMFVLPA